MQLNEQFKCRGEIIWHTIYSDTSFFNHNLKANYLTNSILYLDNFIDLLDKSSKLWHYKVWIVESSSFPTVIHVPITPIEKFFFCFAINGQLNEFYLEAIQKIEWCWQ